VVFDFYEKPSNPILKRDYNGFSFSSTHKWNQESNFEFVIQK